MTETISQFRIIPPLYELHQCTVHCRLLSGDGAIDFTVVESGLPPAFSIKGTGHVLVPGDDLGVLHNTLVRVHLPGRRPLETDHSGPMPVVQQAAIDLLNAVIDVYRYVVDAPQIRRVPYRHARSFLLTHVDDGGERREAGFWLGGNGLKPEGAAAKVPVADPDVSRRIENLLAESGPPPPWVVLFMDAKAERESNNARSCLANLYMAFEMMAADHLLRLAAHANRVAETQQFLNGGEDGEPPSVRVVLKKALEVAHSSKSRTKLMKECFRFWRYRNDVMHGKALKLDEAELAAVLEQFRALTGVIESLP